MVEGYICKLEGDCIQLPDEVMVALGTNVGDQVDFEYITPGAVLLKKHKEEE